jgi:phosphatidylserine/phosphatidylglycerophosphate/cardiolipin synthase-like enzyme
MAFSFTVDEIRDAILARASSGVTVQGIFENVGSETRFSELTPLFCAGLPMRQDGNPFIMHHKVFIIDDTVLTGSFNFSASATNSNDENMVIIEDSNLAAQFNAEFDRRWAEAATPDDLTCS